MQDMRILIVDDDPKLCAYLQEALASWNIPSQSVTNPLLVPSLVQETFYNVVILDVVMPEKSGLELLAEIRTLSPDSKIIMMTGFADKGMAIEALRLGALDFLEKPITLDLLSHAVHRALEMQKIELEYKRTLVALQQSQQELLVKTQQLEEANRELTETNKALSVLAQSIEKSRKAFEERMVMKVRSLILPLIEKLRQDPDLQRYEAELAMVVEHIENLTSGLATNLQIATALSFSELRIASMIKNGMTTDQIAAHLHISPDTVKTHRKNIRKKLKIVGTKQNLRTYLSSLDQ
ncbi:MAG: response regulator [Nitrospinota bacterium]|nr:MAG: response regulator [Nitrospinota bacterium]